MYLSVCYVVPLVYVLLFVTYVVMYLFIKRLQLHHQRDLRLQHTILNKEIIHKKIEKNLKIKHRRVRDMPRHKLGAIKLLIITTEPVKLLFKIF